MDGYIGRDFTVKKLNIKSKYGYFSNKCKSMASKNTNIAACKNWTEYGKTSHGSVQIVLSTRFTWLQVLVVQPPGSQVQEPSQVPRDPNIPLQGNCSPYIVQGSHPPVHPSGPYSFEEGGSNLTGIGLREALFLAVQDWLDRGLLWWSGLWAG